MQYCKDCDKDVEVTRRKELIKGITYTYVHCRECGAFLFRYAASP